MFSELVFTKKLLCFKKLIILFQVELEQVSDFQQLYYTTIMELTEKLMISIVSYLFYISEANPQNKKSS